MMPHSIKETVRFETHNYQGFDTIGYSLVFQEDLTRVNIRQLCHALHTLIKKQNYSHITLDFSKTTRVWYTRVLVLLSQVRYYTSHYNTTFQLMLPAHEMTSRLFVNAGWAHFINPQEYEYKPKVTQGHLPTQKFSDIDEATEAIDKIMEITLRSLALPKENLGAFEWALSEMADNVLSHSRSNLGGYIHIEIVPKNKLASFCFVDAGAGVPKTLREAIPDYTSDVIALENSIKEGVTSNQTNNRGNGLFGCYRMAVVSEGSFKIESGYAKLIYSKEQGLILDSPKTPFPGTYLECKIGLGSDLLPTALTFNDKQHQVAFDYADKIGIASEEARTIINIKDESKSCRLRADGLALRNKITNTASYSKDAKVVLDFSGITVMSSSFADEAFGKLFLEFGIIGAMKKFELANLNTTTQVLIDRAIAQRSSK